ncbi:putative methyltransferase TARBP1 [Polymixia lowei]
MSSVLIKAFLSSVPNYDILFDALSWPSDSWPERQRVEALTEFIEGIGQHLADSSADDIPFTAGKRQYFIGKVESIIWTQCIPFLSKISEEAAARKGVALQDMRCRESTIAVCRLLGVCVSLCDDAVAGRVGLSVLPALQLSKGDVEEEGRLDVEVAIEVMAVLLPTLSSDERLTAITLSSALSCIKTLSDAVVSKITVRLIFTLLNCCSGARLSSTLQFILDDIYTWHLSKRTPVVTERTLLCLTALSDHLFPPAKPQQPCQSLSSSQPDPRLSCQFWRIVQDGLTHRDNVSRKRALYLLKRCVALSEEREEECPRCPSDKDEILFKWDPNRSKLLREFWEDYALVMETLEENQVHVVRPVLNRIDMLIQTTAVDSQVLDRGLFHPSWLLCVYQRMFHSENKSLMKEGVNHLLELQALQQPVFALAFSQFIVGPFMDVLSESSLFHRATGQSVGDCPELGAKLQVFMVTFFNSLPSEDRGSVLLQLIQRLDSQHWCAVPILFLSRALSSLPRSPLLGADGLHALREVMRCTMITHQVLLRGAAQCFLLRSALSLTQVSSVTLDDFFSLLMHFRADESLCRGTQLWNQLTAWLSDNEGRFKPCVTGGGTGPQHGGDDTGATVNKETVRAYVQSEINTFLRVPASTGQTERLPDPKEADKLARAVLLCVDMEGSGPGGPGLESLLSPLLDTLSRVSTNVYLPLRKTDKSLQLMLRLFQLRGIPGCQDAGEDQGDSVVVATKKLILKVADPIREFILRRLCGELQELSDVDRAELYLCVLRQLAVMHSAVPQHRNEMQHTCFPKLIRSSLKVLQEPTQQVPTVASQVARAVAMASLAMVCGLVERQVIDRQSETMSVLMSLNDYFYSPACSSPHSQVSLRHFNQILQKPQTADGLSDAGVQAPLLKDWGRTAAHFIRDQWICLSFLMRTVVYPASVEASRDPGTLKAALGCSVEALALLPSDLVLPVLAFMEAVLPQVALCEEDLCVEAVTLSWELVQGLSTNPHDFWPALTGFISMTFHRSLLQLKDAQALKLTATLKQIAGELTELSQSKTGVFNVLVQHCCQTWLPSGPGGGDRAAALCSSAFGHINILIEACVYGPVFRRDQRLIQEVQTYVEQLGDECAANMVVTGDNRDDQLPRMCALAFLCRLDSSSPLHERLMEDLVIHLLKKDKEISKSKVRYYSNSLQHRVKNRVWQTLLLLLPKLKEEFVATLLNHVFEAAFCSNQASVKYLIEWMMILILVRYPQYIESFWTCFSMDQEKTKTSICTFLSVLVHLNIIMPKLEDKAAQWRRAMDVILRWCFSHNFSVRLYALLALKRVWSLAEAKAEAEEGADGLGGLSTVVNACLNQAEAMQSTGNANKNWTRIQEHFFFGAFQPIRDYSIETLFYTFPSLSELADDEWIPPWKFEKLWGFPESLSLPLRNPVCDLSQLQPGDWIQQDKGEHDKEERWAEVQKKITPWRLGIQEQEPELQLVPQQRAARLGKLHGALLVVASLIDKPTNLGGLCRTCEIFGASALVLDSLRHVADKHFQSLSVSSQLWLPLLEVKPVELADFLQLKKSEGYCIVGVEQTANSQSLQDYQFPEKTLLLLGNEREGIPANLLQLLDVCVEIPQQGVIRSLNVHVSAALLIWEYTRQHLAPG